MPSKKHLGSHQGSRTNRRRTVQLSEFLRGDDEGAVLQQAKSQNSNEGSIGWVTGSRLVSPDTPTNEPEKAHPGPRIPLNVWQLSSAEKDPSRGTFRPDQQAFPDLGKQAKKVKTLTLPDANRATGVSLDTASPRRGGPVLGNFMPEPLLPEPAAAERDHDVSSWRSSVRSAAVGKSQCSKLASCSPPRLTILKRAKSPGYPSEQKMTKQPEEPALELGPSQQSKPQKSPGGASENEPQQKTPAGPSTQEMPENPSARVTKSLVEIQDDEEEEVAVVPTSQSSTQDQQQSLDNSRSFSEASDESSLEHQTVEKAERETAEGLFQRQDQVLAPIQRSLLNANAEVFRPMVRKPEGERERQWEPLFPAEESPQEPYESRLKRRRRLQRANRSKRWLFEQGNYGQVFENQVPLAQGHLSQQRISLAQRQRLEAGLQQQQQQQSQASISLPRYYYNVPAAHHHQQRQRQHPAAQFHQANQVFPVYATQAAYRAPRAAPVYGAPPLTPSARLDYVAAPATRSAYRASSRAAPVYVASPVYAGAATPIAYGAPPAATPFYAAPPPASRSHIDYIVGPATPIAYGAPPSATPFYAAPPPPASMSNLDYVAAPAANQTPYGGYGSMVSPFIWAID